MTSRRQKRTEKRVTSWWASRLAEAKGDPARRALVRFNHIQARLADRARPAQPGAWGIVNQRLDDLYHELEALTDSEIAGKEIAGYPGHRG